MIAWIIVMIALTMSVIMVVTPLYFINNIVHQINDFLFNCFQTDCFLILIVKN